MKSVKHTFGGSWTDLKLGCVRDYAAAWARIMDRQKTRFGWRTRYIDAFSGTGTYTRREKNPCDLSHSLGIDRLSSSELAALKKGSAQIAMEITPGFDRIDLIESDPEFARTLRGLADEAPEGRIFVHEQDANVALVDICSTLNGDDRVLLFIDPYGCEVHFDTLKHVANTRVTDVWYLFPTMGVNRQLFRAPDAIPNGSQARLDAVLGTELWRDHFYREALQTDLFGETPSATREAGPDRVESFFLERLRAVFPAVHPDCLRLRNSKNGVMFSLCFAVSNTSDKAQNVAMRIASDVIKKWGRR